MNGYPTAIIWDLDGTLIDSAPDLAQALNTLLAERGHRPIGEDQVRTMIGEGVAKLVERGFAADGEPARGPNFLDLVARFMQIYSDCATNNTRLYPAARSILRHFSVAGVLQGLCTNKPEQITNQILSDLSVAEYFGVVVGGDTTATRKPDPLPMKSCLVKLNTTAESSVMIGDSAVDVATARVVGMRVGIVRHGYARDAVSTLGADFLIDHLVSLPRLVEQLRRAG